MRLKVLGAYGASDAEHNLTGYLIDDWLAVDAGTLTSKLSLAQQSRIQAVYITHTHADHIRDLPHLIHNRFSQNVGPLTIYAAKEVMNLLTDNLFNGIIWPDFAALTSPFTGKAAVHYRAIAAGKKVMVGDVGMTAIPVAHQIPAYGVILEMNGQAITFTGDTGPTQEIWKRTNKTPNVVAVVTEASFPNDQQSLADDSAHLTPQTFGDELKQIAVDAPVYASHRKIPFERDIESQIRNLRDRRARVLLEKNYTLYNRGVARPPVTALIHTLNERDYIEDCLRSVDWADEIYLVDSFSTDGTIEFVLEKFPRVRIEQREYKGAASQKNYAIDRCANEWIFVIDADERITPKLRAEILRTLDGDLRFWAYSVGRRNFMMGMPVRFSGLQRDRVTRLFHRQHARYPNRRVHADLIVDGETGRLQQKMDHFYIRNFDHMIKKMTRYAEWGAAQMFIDGKTTSAAGILGHTAGKFFRDFVINLGFLDGARGVISVGMHVYYTFWKYAKLWELNRLKRQGKPVPLPKLDEDEGRWELPWQKTGPGAQS